MCSETFDRRLLEGALLGSDPYFFVFPSPPICPVSGIPILHNFVSKIYPTLIVWGEEAQPSNLKRDYY